MKTFTLQIITPEETVFSGSVRSVTLPSVCGGMEVLADHAPAFILLGAGAISVHGEAGSAQRYHVEGGFVQISRNAVKILPEHITPQV